MKKKSAILALAMPLAITQAEDRESVIRLQSGYTFASPKANVQSGLKDGASFN